MVRADLFPADIAPRTRRKPRILGHVIDAGDNGLAEGNCWAQLQCRHGHVWETIGIYTITELKRGLPCPTCNPEET